MDNLLTGIIAPKTRIKILMRFFFNPQARSYLRELAKAFNVSSNAVCEGLGQLTKTDLLKSEKSLEEYRDVFPELKNRPRLLLWEAQSTNR